MWELREFSRINNNIDDDDDYYGVIVLRADLAQRLLPKMRTLFPLVLQANDEELLRVKKFFFLKFF